MKYNKLMTNALQANADRVNMLIACEGFINSLEAKGKEWEADLEIESVSFSFPLNGDDYTLVSTYLEEKGSIIKDVNFMIDDLEEFGFVIDGDKYVDDDNQIQSWKFKYTKSSFKGEHPKLTLKINATKSKKCIQVDTGRTKPVYEMKCVDT